MIVVPGTISGSGLLPDLFFVLADVRLRWYSDRRNKPGAVQKQGTALRLPERDVDISDGQRLEFKRLPER